ncbi:hypothetical protein SGPA1_10739 [Streptomyces misionensis JCM 4497]
MHEVVTGEGSNMIERLFYTLCV